MVRAYAPETLALRRASSGTGLAHSGGCAGDLHHGWYSRTGPVWQRRHEPGLGCDGGLCWWCTGLTRIRRRTYISVTLPVLGGSPRVHRREVKRARCHGRGDGWTRFVLCALRMPPWWGLLPPIRTVVVLAADAGTFVPFRPRLSPFVSRRASSRADLSRTRVGAKNPPTQFESPLW